MTFAIVALFGLIYAIFFAIGIWYNWSLWLMIGLTLGILFFQYLISPYIINWVYAIQWIPFEEYRSEFPHLAETIEKVCMERKIKIPRMGIIRDGNPNAFTFGWTKNSARIVLTTGILQHLNKKEQKAVVAHELGHVVHNDFIIMTLVFAIPLIFFTIARWAFYTARFSRSDSESALVMRAAFYAIAALSFIAYYIGFLISLFISRIREYYADKHAAEVLEDPNALSTALVKIAYGLLKSGVVEETVKARARSLSSLGIFNPNDAKTLAASSAGASGQYSNKTIQAAAAWDLHNPWAKYFQLFGTHPLPAKRILALNKQCVTYGIEPEIDLSGTKKIKEEQAGKSMIPEFLTDFTIKILPILVIILLIFITLFWILGAAGLIFFFTPTLTPSNVLLFWAAGCLYIAFACILRTMLMFKKYYGEKQVIELLTNIKVSPIRCVPAVIEGHIIGRGQAGYYFGEDLYFRDSTGLMYIDYRSGIPFGDLFFALTKARRLYGRHVRIRGWYRRGPGPYFQVDRIYVLDTGKRYRNYYKHMTYLWAVLFFIIGFILFYIWFNSNPAGFFGQFIS